MDNNSVNIKPSFFDDASSTDYTIWKKGIPLKKPSENRLMEGILFRKSQRTNFWKSRYYVLFEDRFSYYKNARQPNEQAYCHIHNMRVERVFTKTEKEDIFGIRLVHNNLYCEMYARSREVQEKWLAALTRFCVFTNYSTNFVNIKVIGKGSFARVFLAKRRNNGLDFAVKTFDKNMLLAADKARASLINEINIMRRLEHENIINLFEVYESDNHIYLVLELLHGGELFDRIVQKGQYKEKDACVLMRNLLNALNYMHSKGFMHRDLKPENLILKDNQNDLDIKIADFGLATLTHCTEHLFKRCGTPGYVAPEVLADEKYDEKVDVFSAGVILYILLTGGSPFHANSYNQILWKNKNCEINFNFRQFGQRVSEPAVDLMKKMLAKDPKDRISTSEALEHPWIVSGGVSFSPITMTPIYLNNAQDNMRKFQEENRYFVKNKRPQDNDPSALERSGHAPSPLINGRMVTVADSRNQFYMNSPDIRKPGNGPIVNGKFSSNNSPQEGISIASTKDDVSDRGALSVEIDYVAKNLGGYNHDRTLLSQLTNVDKSNNSSMQTTPVMTKKVLNAKKNLKKALNVQDTLLKYLGQNQEKAPVKQEQTVIPPAPVKHEQIAIPPTPVQNEKEKVAE